VPRQLGVAGGGGASWWNTAVARRQPTVAPLYRDIGMAYWRDETDRLLARRSDRARSVAERARVVAEKALAGCHFWTI